MSVLVLANTLFWRRAILGVMFALVMVAAPVAAEQLARLRAIKGPQGEFHRDLQGVSLKNATVLVKNVSSHTATDVTVLLVIPGGAEVTMTGPSLLEKYAEAEYTVSGKHSAQRSGRLRITFSCKNCRK